MAWRKREIAESDIDENKVRRYVTYARWVWLIGTAVSVVAAVVAVVANPGAVTAALTGFTLVQAAVAIPAALALPRRARWARNVLYVLGLMSAAGLYSALRLQAWPSLLLNLVLVTGFAALADPHVKAAFDAAQRRRTAATVPA